MIPLCLLIYNFTQIKCFYTRNANAFFLPMFSVLSLFYIVPSISDYYCFLIGTQGSKVKVPTFLVPATQKVSYSFLLYYRISCVTIFHTEGNAYSSLRVCRFGWIYMHYQFLELVAKLVLRYLRKLVVMYLPVLVVVLV